MLPYDATAAKMLQDWTAATEQVQGACEAYTAVYNSLTTKGRTAFFAKIEAMKARRNELKAAHDRYRYQLANPTHPVARPYQVVAEVFMVSPVAA